MMKILQKNKPYLLLISGRVYYRLAFLALTIVLSTVWVKGDFGYYAAKMGTWIIIDTILGAGMGISIPKLLVLHKPLKELIVRGTILLASLASLAIVIAISAIGFLLANTIHVDFDILDVLIICSLLSYSISTVLQGIYRVLGKVSYDYFVSYILGSIILLLALFSFFVSMSPITNVIYRTLFFILTDIYLVYKILKLFPLQKKYSRKFYKTTVIRLIKESSVLATNNVVIDANFSVINIVFRFYNLFEAAADFNLVLAVAGPILAFYRYLLIIFIPKIVDFARKKQKYYMDKYSKRFLSIVSIIVLISVASAFMTAASGSGIINLGILFVCWTPLLILFETLLMYFEATMTKNLIFTARGCIIGFVACSISTVLLVPRFYATGAFFSLILLDIVMIIYFLSLFYSTKNQMFKAN